MGESTLLTGWPGKAPVTWCGPPKSTFNTRVRQKENDIFQKHFHVFLFSSES